MTTGSIPRTAAAALELWDAGIPVPAFQVESEGASQEEIYGFAFDLLRHNTDKTVGDAPATLSDRERAIAYSIASVARSKGWAMMLKQHIGPGIPALTIQKGQ